MRGRSVAGYLAVAVAAVLCGCSAGGSGGGSGGPSPTVSSTPPAVQRTVAAGSTFQGDGGNTGATTQHVMPDGQSMSGMSMPGMSTPAQPSIVPNGTGSYAVSAPNVDGCNRAYGLVTQCVPMRAPGGGPVTCTFLESYHYLPLLVTRDPLKLLTRAGVTARVTGGKRYLTGCSA